MNAHHRHILILFLVAALLTGVRVCGQSSESDSEPGFLPTPDKDAFASIQKELKKRPAKKEINSSGPVQAETPTLDRKDFELYANVTSLLPDVKAALNQLETVINGRVALSVAYRPGPVLYYLWGNLKYQQGDYEGALEKYESALEAFPMYRKACMDAGIVAFQLGLNEKAILYLERGLAAEGVIKEPRINNMLADLYYERGSVEKAIQTYQETIAQDEINLYAHLRLAWIYYRQDDDDETLKYVLRSISLGGGNKDTYLIVARIYADRGKPHAALTALEQARFFDPESRSLRHFQLALLDQQDRVPELISLGKGLLEEDDRDVLVWRYLADAYTRNGQNWKAIATIETLLLLGENEAELLLSLATLYADEELPIQGMRELIRVLNAPGNRKFSDEILAFAESLLTQVPESEATDLLEAIEPWVMETESDEAERLLMVMRIRHLLNVEQYAEARILLENYIGDNNDDALAHLFMGDLESRSGNYVDARIHLERAALDGEHRPDALIKLGLLELRQGRANKCLEYLADAYALRPTPELKRYILRLCRYYQTDPLVFFSDL